MSKSRFERLEQTIERLRRVWKRDRRIHRDICKALGVRNTPQEFPDHIKKLKEKIKEQQEIIKGQDNRFSAHEVMADAQIKSLEDEVELYKEISLGEEG